MKRFHPVVVSIALTWAALGLGGCESAMNVPAEKTPDSIPVDPVPPTAERPWRFIFLFLDGGDLTDQASRDIRDLAQYDDPLGHLHRLVLRETTYDGTAVSIASGGKIREIGLPNLPKGSLLNGDTVAAVLQSLADAFPAEKQAIFISGHGRGWRGIGYSERNPALHLTPREIRTIVDSVSSVHTIMILEAGWSGFTEVLFALADAAVDVVAAGTNLARSGIDYEGLIMALHGGSWSTGEVEHEATRAMTLASDNVPAIHLRATDLAQLPAYLEDLVIAGEEHTGSLVARDQLRQGLLARASTATLPGDAHLRLGDLAEAMPGLTPRYDSSPLENLLIHLVSVDELGLPAGHDTHYRADSDSSGDFRFFQTVSWAPDFFGRRGFLFDLWYKEY